MTKERKPATDLHVYSDCAFWSIEGEGRRVYGSTRCNKLQGLCTKVKKTGLCVNFKRRRLRI